MRLEIISILGIIILSSISMVARQSDPQLGNFSNNIVITAIIALGILSAVATIASLLRNNGGF